MQKLNSGELETNLNTDFDDLSVYFNNSDTIGIVNFITENLIYKAEQTYTPPPPHMKGYAALQGDIIFRNTELADMNFLSAAEAYEILDHYDFDTFKSKVSGSYSIIYTKDNYFVSGNDSMGIEHIYYAQTAEHIFISNRIRFIQIFLGNKAHPDLFALSNITLMGSTLGNDTSINEIKKIPQGSYITVENGNFHLHKKDLFFYNNPDVSEACKSDFTGFVRKELNVCINKMSAVLKRTDNFSLGLSGGKDSRMMLAMLFQIKDKKDIHIFTNGYDNHPDVVVAKMIAKHYNLHHTVNTPKAPTELSVREILEKLMGSVFQTDGMIGLFDAKGNRASSPCNLTLSGHINELFRFHTKESIKISSLDDIINYYKTIHLYDPLGMMRAPLLEEFNKKFTERAEYYNASGMSLEDLNETYFVCDRVPNWVGYLLRTDGYAQSQLQVVNNDRLIQAFYRDGCTKMRKAELLHFITLKEFGDKWLIECPFAAQQWNPALISYEKNINFLTPAIPVPSDIPQFGTWQHKLNSSLEFKTKLLDIFLSYPHSEIWQLFDKDKVIRSLLSSKLSYTPLISMYGFINMFFFYHNIELPIKIQSCNRKTKSQNTVIRLNEGSTIYEYDNHSLKRFTSFEEFKASGMATQYRFPISSKSAEISTTPDSPNTDAIITNLKNRNEKLEKTINEIKASTSFRLARKLSATGNKIKPIKKIVKHFMK